MRRISISRRESEERIGPKGDIRGLRLGRWISRSDFDMDMGDGLSRLRFARPALRLELVDCLRAGKLGRPDPYAESLCMSCSSLELSSSSSV